MSIGSSVDRYPLPILIWQRSGIWGARLRQMYPRFDTSLVEVPSGDRCCELAAETPQTPVLVELCEDDLAKCLRVLWRLQQLGSAGCRVVLANRHWCHWEIEIREAGAAWVCFSAQDLVMAAHLLDRWAARKAEGCTGIRE